MNLQEAIEYFVEADESGDFEERRYPACIDELNGVVAIADEDDNGSNLSMFAADDFISWMEEAKSFCDEHDEQPWVGIWETRPEHDNFQSH